MICVIQRVKHSSVIADGVQAGKIGEGLYLLVGVISGDSERDATALAEKISKLRIFSDENGKMNLSVKDIGGECLAVSNFTLGANYSRGNRPDYFGSAAPDEAERLYNYFVKEIERCGLVCKTGVFGADMQTDMQTDGPVTIVMDSGVLLKKSK